jgi:hypothetical protein
LHDVRAKPVLQHADRDLPRQSPLLGDDLSQRLLPSGAGLPRLSHRPAGLYAGRTLLRRLLRQQPRLPGGRR